MANPNRVPGSQMDMKPSDERTTVIPPNYDPIELDRPHRPTTPPPPPPPPRTGGTYSHIPGKRRPKSSPGSYSQVQGKKRSTDELESSLLGEVFQEFENEFYSQEFEANNYNDSLPPTRRDGAAARAVDRQKATDQMPATRRDGTAARSMDQQKVNSMSFKNGTAPKRFGGQRSSSPKGRRSELELSVLDEIFQEFSF